MNNTKLLLLLATSLLLACACRKDASFDESRSNFVGNWKVDSRFAYSKDNKEIASSESSFFLKLQEDGNGTRTFLSFKDTIEWAYQKSPESIFILSAIGSGFTPSGTRFEVKKNDNNSQVWTINTQRLFYVDTSFVLRDYNETWKLARQ